jgi:hypothetical protein
MGIRYRDVSPRYSAFADVFAPLGGAFGDGEVGHEVVGGGAVPVPLVGGRAHDLAGVDGDDGLATGLNESFALGHVEGLSVAVGMPGGVRAGCEVHGVDGQA